VAAIAIGNQLSQSDQPKEKTENFLEISRLLRDLNRRMAMDLVVMTRTQWERFVGMDSGFSREVQEKGLLLI
jgi:hypothetical protein